jgi:putative tricarboxylic transport membrane protein
MRTKPLSVGVAALAVLTASACGATSSDASADAAAEGKPVSGLRMMVPNSPGGGYDVTARTGAKVMDDAKIATGLEVFNLSGAGGTVGLAKLEGQPQDGGRRRLEPRRSRPPAADAVRPGGGHRRQDGQLRVVRRRR